MHKIFGIIKLSLSVLILFAFLQCNTPKTSNCGSTKIEMLLEDFFKKKSCFLVFKTVYESLDKNVIFPPDSSMYFGYLNSSNFKIPDKEFYLHWNKELVPEYPDSVKLRVINNLSEMSSSAFLVGVGLAEVNEDSTRLKLSFNSGIGKNIVYEGTYSYFFDEIKCKWIVLDSTISYSVTR
jgi:hypothetical protein